MRAVVSYVVSCTSDAKAALGTVTDPTPTISNTELVAPPVTKIIGGPSQGCSVRGRGREYATCTLVRAGVCASYRRAVYNIWPPASSRALKRGGLVDHGGMAQSTAAAAHAPG